MVIFLQFVIAFLLFQYVKCQDDMLCQNQVSCDSCMRVSSQCRWCSQDTFPYKRCNTEDNLILQGCNQTLLINEESQLEIEGSVPSQYYQIQPGKITITYRTNTSFEFAISVMLLSYLPVETGFVLDFSYSMMPVFDEIIKLASDITTTGLQAGITKIGYSKFVDKTSYPVIYPYDYDPSHQTQDNPFNFDIIAPLSNDSEFLLEQLEQHSISTNLDAPETVLDALIQTIVCPVMGWSSSQNILKTLILITDENTKIQGDGQGVGILKPHDLGCHADESGFDPHGMSFDYPSVAQAGYVLRQTKTEIIFVVDSLVKPHYENMVKQWSGVNWVITDLDTSSLDLLALLSESRKELNSKVSLTYDGTPDLKITINSDCVNFTGTECNGVELNQPIYFNVNVEILNLQGDSTINFYVSSLATIPLYYQPITQCECSNTVSSGSCMNGGTYTCGACKCVEPYGGDQCQCTKNENVSNAGCLNIYTKTMCTDRGTCDACGVCSCYTAPDGLPYEGSYCECSRAQCGTYNGSICGGPERGVCVCDVCECNEAYAGKACENIQCDNPQLQQACIATEDSKPCSGTGDCLCGVCVCDAEWEGTYCEMEALVISCETYEDAVSCYLSQTPVNPNFNCSNVNATLEDFTAETYECVRIDSANCKMYYNYIYNDTNVVLQVKKMDPEVDCEEEINVFAVTMIVFIVIILIGLLIFGIYFIILYLHYRADYRKFIKETQIQDAGITNPLYDTA